MKLLFIGNCIFRNDTDHRVCNPFKTLKKALKKADVVILTLQGNITKRHIPSNQSSVGEQLLALKRIIPRTPIIIDFKNTDLLNLNPNGKKDTSRFLTNHGFIYSYQVIRPLLYGTLCFFSCMDENLVTSRMVDAVVPISLGRINTMTAAYLTYIKSFKCILRTIVVNLRIKPYVGVMLPVEALAFSKLLIDFGVDIVQIQANNSKPVNSCQNYKNGVIICGLGDLVNCGKPRRRYVPITSELCLFNTITKNYINYLVQKHTVNECIIPKSLRPLRHYSRRESFHGDAF